MLRNGSHSKSSLRSCWLPTPNTLHAKFEYKFMTLLPNDLVIWALKTDSYRFKSVLTSVQSISLICSSVYSFPKYIFELPDRTHATSLSLLSLTSLSSNSFILVSAFLNLQLLRPLLGLGNSESTSLPKLVNWSSISESITILMR